jgi:S-adenosylmethionine:tRNA ribosyltransferase-isomerase
MVVDRRSGRIDHQRIADLPQLLSAGDLVVFNNTQVIPARLLGRREATGGAWQGLFLGVDESGAWELLSQTRGKLLPGQRLILHGHSGQPHRVRLQVLGRTAEGHLLVRPDPTVEPPILLGEIGHVPLPPYIRKGADREEDRLRYQTVFASRPGSVAAPTAGLHFSADLLQSLTDKKIGQAFLTLHVGPGTFLPVKVERLADHRMHQEWYQIDEETARKIEDCRARQGRIVAVGTTTVRALESAAEGTHRPSLPPVDGREDSLSPVLSGGTGGLRATDLFIRPGHSFRRVDALVTNFHLPRSTLLVLVCAFAGRDLILRAYQEAVRERYRFFSYGDAMLIL